ncbi:hypothetical protein V1279_003036 [Bradyrhizobium sp. AZCC 1610]
MHIEVERIGVVTLRGGARHEGVYFAVPADSHLTT